MRVVAAILGLGLLAGTAACHTAPEYYSGDGVHVLTLDEQIAVGKDPTADDRDPMTAEIYAAGYEPTSVTKPGEAGQFYTLWFTYNSPENSGSDCRPDMQTYDCPKIGRVLQSDPQAGSFVYRGQFLSVVMGPTTCRTSGTVTRDAISNVPDFTRDHENFKEYRITPDDDSDVSFSCQVS